jgi:nucleoside-diphosphate-sugar epimerase
MRVLVTGAGGCLGRFIAGDLAARGFDVVALVRSGPEPASATPRLRWLRSDLCAGTGLPESYDAVVHAAATSPAPGVTTDMIVRDNVEGMRRLVLHAQGVGARTFLFCSAMSVYGTVNEGGVTEETSIRDPDTYGMTKLIGEHLLAASNLRSLSLRLPAVVGPGAKRNFLATAAARFQVDEAVTISNPDSAYNNAVHCADISAFVAGLLRGDWKGRDVVVLGAAGLTTVRGAMERLRERLGSRSPIEICPSVKPAFSLSSRRGIERYGYAPMEISAMLDRFGDEVRRHDSQ